MASNMVQIPNKGRELAVIQSVSYLATLLKDIKTHCFVVWQAEIFSVQFLFLSSSNYPSDSLPLT